MESSKVKLAGKTDSTDFSMYDRSDTELETVLDAEIKHVGFSSLAR